MLQTRALLCSSKQRHASFCVGMQAIWPGVLQRHGAVLDAAFDMSTLAHISDAYSSGTIDQVDIHTIRDIALLMPLRHCLHCSTA